MPLRLVEALRGEELLTAADVDGAFPTLGDFVQWATDSAGGLTKDEQSQAGIALEKLRSETETDVGPASELPAAPEPKAIPWFVSAAPIPAQVGHGRERLRTSLRPLQPPPCWSHLPRHHAPPRMPRSWG